MMTGEIKSISPMRILVLIHEYPPLGGGGGRVAQDLCGGLVQRGHQVCILTAHWEGLPFEEKKEGVQIVRLKCWRRQPFRADLLAMAGYVIASTLQGLSYARRWKPDLIHAHFAVPAGAAARVISLFSGVPYILTAHLGDVPGGVPEKTGRWFRWIYPFTPSIWKKAVKVLAVSEFTRSLALKKYPVPVQVIPNGVDTSEIKPKHEIAVHNPPQIVFAGRFVEQKNPLQVVHSLAEVRDLPWHCAMLGDGALRPDVEAEIKRQNLGDRFSLPGWIMPEEVLGWFERSDILFMPSLSEGLPVVGVQGMAMGLALVLSNAGGNPELVSEGENGYLIENPDTQVYAGSLRSLLSNPSKLLAMRLASRAHASRFDLRIIVDQYEKLFKESTG
jgi:L-malate glycosyltransferase